MSLAGIAVGLALLADVVIGEPPTRFHPVAWFGRVVTALDRSWRRPRAIGVVLAVALPLSAATVAGLLVWLAGRVDWSVAIAVGSGLLFATTSARSLLLTVRRVSRLAETDLAAARAALPALAGRDASGLDEAALRSAALESLAENLSDGLVGPLTAFTLGALAGGALGFGSVATLALACACAVWLKAVNTLDSMLGYRDRSLGTGAARTDDLAMWLPARLTALLLAGSFAAPGALRAAANWTGGVPSPNAGWPMGVLAAALGVRLEKPGVYVLNPDGRTPSPADTRRALRRVGLAALSAYGIAGVLTWY